MILPVGIDPSLVGVLVIAKLMPLWAALLFIVMLLAALSSTIDAGLNAVASLFVADIMKYSPGEHDLMLRAEKGEALNDKELLQKHLLDTRRLGGARTSMVFLTIIGYLVTMAVIYIPHFGLFQLWWVFNTVAACVVMPTVLSLYWEGLNPKGVFWGVLIGFFVGLPIFIYGNFISNNVIVVLTSLGIIAVTTLFCVLWPKKVK